MRLLKLISSVSFYDYSYKFKQKKSIFCLNVKIIDEMQFCKNLVFSYLLQESGVHFVNPLKNLNG